MSRQREVALSLGIQGPYPGLRPYQRHESLIFFGRERQIDQMKEKLRTVRFLGVVGSSGCGKSSLVRAGLFSALDSGFLVTRDLPWASRWPAWTASRWFVADMQPRAHPFRGLAQGLLQSGLLGERWDAADPANVPALAARLQSGPGQLLRLWEQAQGEPDGNLLIVVDQFEELFRFQDTQHAGLAQAFVSSLLELAAQPDWPVYVAITMRSDFLGDCAMFPGLPEVLNAGQFLVSRLAARDIQAAIKGPARIFDVELDPLLVTRMLNDVGTDSDQLPLLQHALKRTWDLAHVGNVGWVSDPTRSGQSPNLRTLTLAEYDRPQICGASQALDRHAEEVFGSLAGADDNDGDKRAARLLFQCLTTRDANQRDVRRPTPVAVVAEVAEVPVERVIGVVEAFRHPDCCFLTPPAPVTLAANDWLDISHESLLRQWQRLRQWVKAEADSADELQRLVRDARSWEAGNRGLLRQPELGVLVRWRDRQKPTAAWAVRYVQSGDFALANRYLEESGREEERQRKEKEEARQQELERERQRAAEAEAASRRQRKLARIAWAVAAGSLLLLAVVMLFTWRALTAAVNRSEQMVKEQAYRGNDLLAKFVAKVFEAEIADYFAMLEQEASSPEFLDEFLRVLDSENLRAINDPATPAEQLMELRARFLDEPVRQGFKASLERRLARVTGSSHSSASKFASIFVADALGTWVAGVYSDEVVAGPIGENFSWRTYFRGGQKDAPPQPPGASPQHIEATHLSAAFKSSTTKKWKVAVSTPVYDRTEAAPKFLGILAVTFNVGDFAVFRTRHAPPDYFAVLIDSRPGDRQGTVLQHPLFQEQPPEQDFQVPLPQLHRLGTEPVYDYLDPLAQAAGGEACRGDWIAATQPVGLPSRNPMHNGQRNDTDLLVLVQVSARAATSPVNQLGRRLALDAAAALAVVVLVVIALWAVVFRISGDRAGRGGGKPHAAPEPTPPHDLTTLPATPRKP